jgi:hypothetical protein
VTAKRDLRIDKSLNHAAKLVAAVCMCSGGTGLRLLSLVLLPLVLLVHRVRGRKRRSKLDWMSCRVLSGSCWIGFVESGKDLRVSGLDFLFLLEF